MKYGIASDLHLDWFIIDKKKNRFAASYELLLEKFSNKNQYNDYLILAGDTIEISNLSFVKGFFELINKSYKKVFIVAGNHEFYGGYFPSDYNTYKEFFKKNNLDNIVFLQDDYYKTENDVTVIGSTLWTSMKGRDAYVEWLCARSMSDYHRILKKSIDEDREYVISPVDTVNSHVRSMKMLEEIMNDSEGTFNNKNLIITHHAPSWQSISEEFRSGHDMIVSNAYATELGNFIVNNTEKIPYWIHGHTHAPNCYNIGETRIISNPFGYNGRDNLIEEYDLVTIEL